MFVVNVSHFTHRPYLETLLMVNAKDFTFTVIINTFIKLQKNTYDNY